MFNISQSAAQAFLHNFVSPDLQIEKNINKQQIVILIINDY